MWITAYFPVIHIPTAATTDVGFTISEITHFVLLAPYGVDRQLGLVVAMDGYSLAFEALGQKRHWNH